MNEELQLHDTYAYGLWAAVAFNVLFILLFVLSFLAPRKKREEKELEGSFGEAYRNYKERTPGFWPAFGRRRAQTAERGL